jgi:hypothetical protein
VKNADPFQNSQEAGIPGSSSENFQLLSSKTLVKKRKE